MSIYDSLPRQREVLVVGGAALNDALGWAARSVIVDNPTTQHVHILDAGRWVAPGVRGECLTLNGSMVAAAEFVPPPGVTDPPPVAGQQAQLTFYAEEFPPSSGTAISVQTASPELLLGKLVEGDGSGTVSGTFPLPAGATAVKLTFLQNGMALHDVAVVGNVSGIDYTGGLQSLAGSAALTGQPWVFELSPAADTSVTVTVGRFSSPVITLWVSAVLVTAAVRDVANPLSNPFAVPAIAAVFPRPTRPMAGAGFNLASGTIRQSFTPTTQSRHASVFTKVVSVTVTNPVTPPTLGAAAAATDLPAGNYTVGYAFVDGGGETILSGTAVQALVATNKLTYSIAGVPASVASVRFYLTVAPGGVNLGRMETVTPIAGSASGALLLKAQVQNGVNAPATNVPTLQQMLGAYPDDQGDLYVLRSTALLTPAAAGGQILAAVDLSQNDVDFPIDSGAGGGPTGALALQTVVGGAQVAMVVNSSTYWR